MLSVTIPERLSLKINELAVLACQTPEELIIEILEEHLDCIVYKKDDFWTALMNFRQDMAREGVQITDSDFEMLRDNSSGREMIWL